MFFRLTKTKYFSVTLRRLIPRYLSVSIMSFEKIGKELKIPVPWGHIAAVEFGNVSGFPILMVHGWQDNLNTFSNLAPLLPPEYHYVAIDLPGHGFSSHKPPGTFYHFIDYVMDVKRVIDYFKWEKLSFISHSLGALMCIFYSSIFPSMTDRLISLDVITLLTVPDEKIAEYIQKGMIDLAVYESSSYEVKPLSKEEALIRLMKSNASLDEKSANILLERGTISYQNSEKVVFSRDFKVKLGVLSALQRLSLSQINSIISKMQCKFLLIRAILNADGTKKIRSEREQETMDILSQSCEKFDYIEVNGTHHVHLTDASIIAPHIVKYLHSYSEITP